MEDDVIRLLRCPTCGRAAGEDDWDCIGACNNNVFCRLCHCEFDPDTGQVHQCDTSAMQASVNREKGVRCP